MNIISNSAIKYTSAVIVPLIETEKGFLLLFTQRSKKLKNHPGEISFPGGKIEKAETPLQAAIRETHEEIGVEVKKILLSLPPISTYTTSHRIASFAGVIENKKFLTSAEVENIFLLPIEEVQRTIPKEEEFFYEGKLIRADTWDFQIFKVWGATGRILENFNRICLKEKLLNFF